MVTDCKITYLRETIQQLERLIQRKIEEHNSLVKEEKNKLSKPDYKSFMMESRGLYIPDPKVGIPEFFEVEEVEKELNLKPIKEVYWNEREFV